MTITIITYVYSRDTTFTTSHPWASEALRAATRSSSHRLGRPAGRNTWVTWVTGHNGRPTVRLDVDLGEKVLRESGCPKKKQVILPPRSREENPQGDFIVI